MGTEDKERQILDWIDRSPTPYHAVSVVRAVLIESGFVALDESESWRLCPGGKYFVERRDASIIAFIHGTVPLELDGIRIIGAHTDSPTLKVKPNPLIKQQQSYVQLGVEVYGGALLNPWFDRDLSIAGRVAIKTKGKVELPLIDFKDPVAVIPSLAIHLDRTANQDRTVNAQTDMKPILLQELSDQDDKVSSFRALLSQQLSRQGISCAVDDILDFDLSFYDTQKSSLTGLNKQFLSSSRLDNLLSCFIGLYSFIHSEGEHSAILALFDHEEVGSQSDIGAKSNFLNSFIERLIPASETRYRALHRSMLLSMDNAHGIHPNYPGKHDDSHAPKLNSGPVLKFDANQSYATSTDSAALIRLMAEEASVPIQSYVTRADMRCGSTIGPMSAAQTGIRTLDLGAATFAMHSIREIAGIYDIDYLKRLLDVYLKMRTLSL